VRREARAGRESLLTVAKAPWARLSRLEKCPEESRLGVSQYPSHLMYGRGGKIWPSRHIGAGEGAPLGSLWRGVLQWMSLVLGTLKPTSQALARTLICSNAFCRVLTFVLYDVDAADNVKSSTYDKDSHLGRLI